MKSYRDNGGGGGGFGARSKTVYDDVFGGPPKFGATTLPPRLEDYTEIFQGFHASRGSSIPVLDLPPPSEDSDDVWFDVQTSKLDYSEVFGGFNGLDFAVSYEELFAKSKVVDDDSSDEVWTPAQSESLSDESDPYASLEMKQHVPIADPDQSFVMKKGFNLSQNMAGLVEKKDASSGMTTDSQFHGVPGSTVVDNHALPSKIEHEKSPLLINTDSCASEDFEGKWLKKSLSQPLDAVFGSGRYGSDLNHLVGNHKADSLGNRPLLSLSDLGLKTQPSHLPPPSRPPPTLTSKKGDNDSFHSKLKTSKSCAFERMTDDRSPPYFDVEIDASSSAAADAAAMKDAVEQAQAKLRSAKELMDRKKEGRQSRSKMRVENNLGDKKGRVNEDFDRANGFGSERMKGSRLEAREENQKVKMSIKDFKSSTEGGKNATEVGTFEHKEEGKNIKTSEVCELEENNARQETHKFHSEGEYLKEPTVVQKACKPRATENGFLASQNDGEIKTPSEADENELYENLIEIQLKDNDMVTEGKSAGANEKVVTDNQLKNGNELKGCYMGSDPYDWEDYDIGLQETIGKEHEMGLKETEEQDGKDVPQPGPSEIETIQGEEGKDHERGESDRIIEDALKWEEYEKISVKASEQEETNNLSQMVSEQDENKKEQTFLQEDLMQEEDKKKAEEVLEQEEKEKACDENEQTVIPAGANEKMEMIHGRDCNSEDDRKLQKDLEREESEIENEQEGTKWEDDSKRVNLNEENESCTGEHSEASDVAYQVDDDGILQATGDVQHDIPSDKNEAIPETPSCMQNGKPRSLGCNEKVGGTVEQIHELGEESLCSSGSNQNELQHEKTKLRKADITNSNSLNEGAGKTYGVSVIGKTQTENDKRTSELTSGSENANNFAHNQGGKRRNDQGAQLLFDQVGLLGNTNNAAPKVARNVERKDESHSKALSEDREKEEKLRRERELENDRLRKIEEERERQIEREKDRMAVDRATLEARERAFVETRERAERAAVERATAEFRQRALAEARERLEKACAEARERSLAEKVSEGRLRVEKATAEARERAERSVVDKFSASRSSGMRQDSLPSDMPESQFQKVGSYSGLRYAQTTAHSGGEGESPQRCKARLERHQRTADRAAKALAEKNMRDLIAQKEQAERNRLAEGLDAEVKRWSSGKQGNLRALLSTLQYILGSDSGWQPVPLTEVITTAAVKKAYRKATLCVHPDKLQQRGATIHQKYICEKVFDLLKEAWNKFNSEER